MDELKRCRDWIQEIDPETKQVLENVCLRDRRYSTSPCPKGVYCHVGEKDD